MASPRTRAVPAVDATALDLGYLALFVGMRTNALVEEQLARAGYRGLRQSHGYVVQHLVGAPRTITALAALLGVSQQAASKTVAELVALGYLETTAGADKRARQVELSKRGRAMLAKTRQLRAALQKRIAATHGPAVDTARTLLASVLADLGGLAAVRQRRIREPR